MRKAAGSSRRGRMGWLCAFVILATMPAFAQIGQRLEPATVSRVRVVLDQGPPKIEINSSRPIVPTIVQPDDPTRLLIDLPNAMISVDRKLVEVKNDDIASVELQQNLTNPPSVRLIVHKLHPLRHEWYGAGNGLVIRLRKMEERTASAPPEAPVVRKGVLPVAATLPARLPSGLVLESSLKEGDPVAAGDSATTLRLTRGGEVRVCPGSRISLVHSKTGPDLLISMSAGALETHYRLGNVADSIVTPDFRILLRGPGEFHYAVRADERGNTCVRALPGTTGTAIVYEQMDNGMFQVTSSNQLFSRTSRLRDPAFPAETCGCPAPREGVLQASLTEPTLIPVPASPPPPPVPATGPLVRSEAPIPPVEATAAVPRPVTQETISLPERRPGEVRTVVEAPLVYRAEEAAARENARAAGDGPKAIAAGPQSPRQPEPSPAPAQKKQRKSEGGGFFKSLKRFMGSIFR